RAVTGDQSIVIPIATITHEAGRCQQLAAGGLAEVIDVDGEAPGLDKTLEHVISEVQRVHPSRPIHSNIGALERIRCDHERIAQLLSNLVSNAISHGDAESPVEVTAGVHGEVFVLSVTNQGEPIPESVRAQLFLPYSRPITDEP
ncbi:GAF:ATP-binding region, ATPase-like:histidine kinase A, partial [Pseudomonas syringae pv. japonica str. M301072]